ncbi:MAG: hypothetical protein GXO68_04550 [Crenarchaeota archaeon]|nr:hypothetical protein [Thermoproteota archaeon]
MKGLLLAALTIYLVIFSLSHGTVVISSPLTVQQIYPLSNAVILINVTYPVKLNLLGITVTNATLYFSINASAMLLKIVSNRSWELSIWGVPRPIQINVSTWRYDDLSKNLTIWGRGNETIWALDPIGLIFSYIPTPVTIRYVPDAVLFGAWVLLYALGLYRWFTRRSFFVVLLYFLTSLLIAVMALSFRSVVPIAELQVGPYVHYIYAYNPLDKVYTGLMLLSIATLVLLGIYHATRHLLYIAEL